MNIGELRIDSWYFFVETDLTPFGKMISCCRYTGTFCSSNLDGDFVTRYEFQLLKGYRFSYAQGSVERLMKPCSGNFSEYLNLFRLGNSDEY